MILISQDRNTMISVNDLKKVVFKVVEDEYEFYRDKFNIERYRVVSYEYQFIINDFIFAKYPDYMKNTAFEMRDNLIQSFLDNKPVFQFVPITQKIYFEKEKIGDIV